MGYISGMVITSFHDEIKNRGFTIVELLIVIVVIGILAAITIVAFNGVQQRARNTQVVSGVSAYVKAFRQYKAVKSTYPAMSGCLGAGYPSNNCWMSGSTPAMSVNASLDTEMAEFLPNKPVLATSLMSIGIASYVRGGLGYIYNDTTFGNRFVYYLDGINQGCNIAGAVAYNEGGVVTQCNISLP